MERQIKIFAYHSNKMPLIIYFPFANVFKFTFNTDIKMFFFQTVKDCGAPCNSMFFSENERAVIRYWVGSWAAVCVASCLFTVRTDMDNERIILKHTRLFYTQNLLCLYRF